MRLKGSITIIHSGDGTPVVLYNGETEQGVKKLQDWFRENWGAGMKGTSEPSFLGPIPSSLGGEVETITG